MSVVHVLQLNNHPADITSLFVEEYMNFYFKHMTVLNVKKQCDLFKVNFCGCQQQKICTFCHFITVSAIWPHWLQTDCRLTADWCCLHTPKSFWRWQLPASGCRPDLRLPSNNFKGNEIARSLHTVAVILVVLQSSTTFFPNATT